MPSSCQAPVGCQMEVRRSSASQCWVLGASGLVDARKKSPFPSLCLTLVSQAKPSALAPGPTLLLCPVGRRLHSSDTSEGSPKQGPQPHPLPVPMPGGPLWADCPSHCYCLNPLWGPGRDLSPLPAWVEAHIQEPHWEQRSVTTRVPLVAMDGLLAPDGQCHCMLSLPECGSCRNQDTMCAC